MDDIYILDGEGLDITKDEINNLYFLKHQYTVRPESLDYIEIDGISKTKFHRIALKEMLIYCKVGGHIIIVLDKKDLLKRDALKSEILLCYGNKVEIEELKHTFVIKKIKPNLIVGDTIDKWTFGIITNGKKNDWVEMQINAIKSQNIPFFEIIVCGTYYNRLEEANFRFRYIPFTEKDDLGWITKKKNIICENARFENICIMHDKMILDKDWFNGMKTYGNNFEVLSCVVQDENGVRAGDWITHGTPLGPFPAIGMLDYKDWDRYGYLDGAFYIMKKSAWRKVKFDEKLFWNQSEDIKLSHSWYKAGIVSRFNPYSKAKTLNWRHGELVTYPFNSTKLGKYPKSWSSRFVPRCKFYIKKMIGRK